MSNSTIPLSNDTKDEIAALVRSGLFANADELVQEGLGLIEWRATTSHEEKVEMLRAAVQRGIDDIDRGNYREFKSADELRAFFEELNLEGAESEKAE